MPKRIEGVDVLRVLAILAVIALHTNPFSGGSWGPPGLFSRAALISQFSRFAVPFFFTVSGYFWGVKINAGAAVLRTSLSMAKRIAVVFVAWSLIYLLPYDVSAVFPYGWLGPIKIASWRVMYLAQHPLDLLFEGTSVHLWFFIGLLSALLISACCLLSGRIWVLGACAIALYLFGLLGKAYVDTPWGIHIPFNTRNGPFFGTLLFASGYLLSRMTPNPGWLWKGIALLVVGYVVQFSELYLLEAHFRTGWQQDYVFGTCFTGVGWAMVGLSNPGFLRIPVLGSVGRMTLGIYAIHVIFVDLLEPVGALTSSALWQVGYVFTVFGLSAAAVFLLAKSRTFRPVVV